MNSIFFKWILILLHTQVKYKFKTFVFLLNTKPLIDNSPFITLRFGGEMGRRCFLSWVVLMNHDVCSTDQWCLSCKFFLRFQLYGYHFLRIYGYIWLWTHYLPYLVLMEDYPQWHRCFHMHLFYLCMDCISTSTNTKKGLNCWLHSTDTTIESIWHDFRDCWCNAYCWSNFCVCYAKESWNCTSFPGSHVFVCGEGRGRGGFPRFNRWRILISDDLFFFCSLQQYLEFLIFFGYYLWFLRLYQKNSDVNLQLQIWILFALYLICEVIHLYFGSVCWVLRWHFQNLELWTC